MGYDFVRRRALEMGGGAEMAMGTADADYDEIGTVLASRG
jgi:hypothetical protein